jgi:predicted dehydrogenase
MSSFSTSTDLLPDPPFVVAWGAIGCGSVCEKKSLPALYKTVRSKVIALCRRDQSALADFAQRHGLASSATLHASAESLIAFLLEYKVQNPSHTVAVYISTPVSTHASLTKLCMVAGIAAYVEKPIARSASESLPLLNPHASSPVFVAYYRRCLPKFQAIKASLPSLGTLSSVSVALHQKRHLMADRDKTHWHFTKEASGGGLLLDLGSHILNLLDYLFGPIQHPAGCAARVNSDSPGGSDIEDVVVGSWMHISSSNAIVPGSCTFNFASSHDHDEITVIGSKSTLRFSTFTDLPATITDGAAPIWSSESIVQFASFGGVQEHVHAPLVKKIVDHLLDGDELDESVTTGEIAHRTQVVMDKLLNSRKSWEDEYVS